MFVVGYLKCFCTIKFCLNDGFNGYIVYLFICKYYLFGTWYRIGLKSKLDGPFLFLLFFVQFFVVLRKNSFFLYYLKNASIRANERTKNRKKRKRREKGRASSNYAMLLLNHREIANQFNFPHFFHLLLFPFFFPLSLHILLCLSIYFGLVLAFISTSF